MFYPGIATNLSGIFDPKGVADSLSISNQSTSTGISQLISNPDKINTAGNPFSAFALQQTDMVNPQLAAVLDSLNSKVSSNNDQQKQRHESSNPHSNAHSHISTSQKNKSAKESNTNSVVPSPVTISDIKIPMDQLIPSHFLETRIRTSSELSSPVSSLAGSPHPDGRNSVSPIPHSLQEHEVQKLADAAIHLIRSLDKSVAEPKFTAKRKTSADYEVKVLRKMNKYQ